MAIHAALQKMVKRERAASRKKAVRRMRKRGTFHVGGRSK